MEKERERNIDVPLIYTLTRDQACNPGMCPNWEFELATFLFAGQNPTNWSGPL